MLFDEGTQPTAGDAGMAGEDTVAPAMPVSDEPKKEGDEASTM